MDTLLDPGNFRTQPHPFGKSTKNLHKDSELQLHFINADAKKLNEQYSNTDFPDRNLALKKSFIRVVATEESLNDWHAQSLEISSEKLARYNKFLNNLIKNSGANK